MAQKLWHDIDYFNQYKNSIYIHSGTMLNDCNEEQIEQYGIFWCLCASTTKDYFYQMQVLLTLMFWMYAKFEFNSMTQWWITYLSSICKKNT